MVNGSLKNCCKGSDHSDPVFLYVPLSIFQALLRDLQVDNASACQMKGTLDTC
jgi:hypothetical protein